MTSKKTVSSNDVPDEKTGLLDAIDAIEDAGVRDDLKRWVEEFDFSKVKTLEDIAHAYARHYRLVLYVAPKYDHLLKSLSLAQKSLDGFAKAYKDYLEIDFPSDIQRMIDGQYKIQNEALRKVLPPEQFARYERLVDEAREEETS